MKVVYSFFVLAFVIGVAVLAGIDIKKTEPDYVQVFTPLTMESSILPVDEVQNAAGSSNDKSDISLLLAKVESEYSSDNKSKAVSELNEVINVIRNKQSKELQEFLPNHVYGWTLRTEMIEGEVKTFPLDQAVAYREFVNDDKLINISIIMGSLLNKEIYELATLSDGSGGVGDYNGYVTKFYRYPEINKLVIATGQNAVVAIEGFKLSHTEALKIANSVDLSKILNYANK